MFNIKNSNVIFDDCNVNGLFGHHAVMFYAQKSKLNFRNCALTANANDYSCKYYYVNYYGLVCVLSSNIPRQQLLIDWLIIFFIVSMSLQDFVFRLSTNVLNVSLLL